MWKIILQVIYILPCFIIKCENADLSLKSSTPIVHKSIHDNNWEISREFNLWGDCKIDLMENTLEFGCKIKSSPESNIDRVQGSFNLDEEAMTMFHCLVKHEKNWYNNNFWVCSHSLNYTSNIFENCNVENIHEINVNDNQHGKDYYTKRPLDAIRKEPGLTIIPLNVDNFRQINGNQSKVIQLLNHVNRYGNKPSVTYPVFPDFKHLKRLDIHFENINDLNRKRYYYFVNLSQIDELRICIEPVDIYKVTNIPGINKNLLRNLNNLRIFTLEFLSGAYEIEIPITLFKGLKNISSITLKACNIIKLTKDHFRDLVNLRVFSYTNGFIYDYDWLRSSVIQNNLTFLELNKNVEVKEPNMTAFICKESIICEFNADVNKKPCPQGCNCFLNREELLFIIDCDRAEVNLTIPELPIPITGNASLYFNGKNLTQLPNSSLYGFWNLRELHLANNKLKSISVEQLPPNLTDLDLRNNSLQYLDRNVIKFLSSRAGIISIKLSENQWKCNCDTHNMMQFFLNSTNNIEDRNNLICHEQNLKLSLLLLEEVCKPSFYIILGTFFGLIFIILVCFYNKKSILMWMDERNICQNWSCRVEPKAERGLKSDAFLAFSHLDLELIKEYVEKLEKGARQYQLSYYQRDWLIGESIPACILNSIEDSKRIIILMTANFINSSWGLFEFRTAIKATSINKSKRLIIILYPGVEIDKLDSELKIYLKYNTYLSRDDPLFWRKLLFAMPHKRVHTEQFSIIEEDQL